MECASTPTSRDDSRCPFVYEISGLSLVLGLFPRIYEFKGEAVEALVEPGLYRKNK